MSKRKSQTTLGFRQKKWTQNQQDKIQRPIISTTQARNALLGLAETKRFAWNVNHSTDTAATLQDGVPICVNPLYWMSLGNNDQTRVGDEIFITRMSIRVVIVPQVVTIGTFPTKAAYSHGLVMLVKQVDEQSTGLTFTNTTNYGTDYRVGGVGDYARPIIDYNKVTVVAKKEFTIGYGANISATEVFSEQVVNLDVSLRDAFKFKSSNAGFGKKHNYYIVVAAQSARGLMGSEIETYGYRINGCTFFKDM